MKLDPSKTCQAPSPCLAPRRSPVHRALPPPHDPWVRSHSLTLLTFSAPIWRLFSCKCSLLQPDPLFPFPEALPTVITLFPHLRMLPACVLSLLQTYCFFKHPNPMIPSRHVLSVISCAKLHRPAGHHRSLPSPPPHLHDSQDASHPARVGVLGRCVLSLVQTGSSFGKGVCLCSQCQPHAEVPDSLWLLNEG